MKKVMKDAEKAVSGIAVGAEKVAEKVAADVKEAPKTAKKATAKAAKTVKAAAEKVEKKAATVKADADAKKAATKTASAKKAALKENVYLQYFGKEISTADLTKQVKEIWTKQMKNKVADMKSVTLYLKPEENRVYYVINDDVTGSIEL